MWVYEQRSGRLCRPDGSEATDSARPGYAGNMLNANYPPAQGLPFGGPIPRGLYRIGHPYFHPRLKALTMNLDPIGHSALGRTDFRIHGGHGNASAGCIILPEAVRREVAMSPVRTLTVR